MKPVNRIALIGVLAAVNVASRVYLAFLPNIKPVTTIIILVTIAFGIRFGLELSATTVLVSGVVFGLGIVTLFQLIAWCIIALFTSLLNRIVSSHKVIIFAVWAFLCGYIFGFFVSLDKLFISPSFFAVYYLNGLSFDTLHAFGNLVFYPLCYAALMPIFRRYAAQLIRKGVAKNEM